MQRYNHAVLETTNQRRALTPVTNDGEFTHIKLVGSAGAERFFIQTGYEGNWSISIFEAPSSAIAIVVSYITENWMKSAAGVAGSEFTANDDVLMLPRKLIESGIIWRFRERKGLPHYDKYNEYETLMARLSNDRRTRRTINVGGSSTHRRPWDVPTPDQIPSS